MRRVVFIFLILLGAPVLGQTGPAAPNSINGFDSARADLVEMLDRRSKLRADDLTGRLALARWCRDRELWQPMADLAREALGLDPQSQGAYALLREYDEKVTLPVEDEAATALQKEFAGNLGHDFKTRQTRHFLIVYDTSDLFCSERGVMLEKAYDSFLFWFNMKYLHPQFLERRLVVILLKDRRDYLGYAQAVDHADMGWSAGYYSQRTNRSVFYDDSTGPELGEVEKKVEELKAQAAEMNGRIDKARAAGQTGLANTLTGQRNQINERIYKINNAVSTDVDQSNGTKTAHEATHALAFNTGIQKRGLYYPLWLSEGIACSFETEDGRGSRGPGVINAGRLAVMKAALKPGAAQGPLPLESLFGPVPAKVNAETMAMYYAEGWALFHYLYMRDRGGVEKLLGSYLMLRAGGEIPEAVHRRLFTEAFGEDLAGVERRFLDYVRQMPAREP